MRTENKTERKTKGKYFRTFSAIAEQALIHH